MNSDGHSYRVLIVDDEKRDWAEPMKEALTDVAKEKGYNGKLKIYIAEDKQQAESLLAKYGFHVTSLDMRLPERKGELLSVDTGLSLARGFPWVGFPKRLIYSQTLRVEEFQSHPNDTMQVLRIPTDLYAKPTGSDADQEQQAVETLTVKRWAERVFDSLINDTFNISTNPLYGKHLSLVGAYLQFGVVALPPLLASHLQTLENNWERRTSDRVEAAIGFIEAASRLALAQSAVLCQAQGENLELPSDERMVTCLNSLEIVRKRLSGWNWCNYLTEETLQALQQARRERNDKAHSVETLDPQKRWANLRSPLQYAMDLASYWVRHPLVVDLRFSRDGWSAELLAGTASPRPRHLLPPGMEYPIEALSDEVWQNTWLLPPEYKDEPVRKAVSWKNWLIPDLRTGKQWWFPICQQGRKKTCLDLISGEIRTFP